MIALLLAALALGAEPSPPDSFPYELTLWAIPSPRPAVLDWSRPGPLTRRTLFNEGLSLPRGIGHAGVRVECAASEARPAGHFQGSMTSTGPEFNEMVLDEKAGLGILFRTVPGRVEREEELQASVDRGYDKGRVAWVRFGISADTCYGLLDWMDAYNEAHVGDRYGFVRPLYGEGAGCSAFSMAFLELAGLVEPWMREEWVFDVRIALDLIGGTTHPGHRVGLGRLLFLSGPWASEDEPSLRLNGWEPTQMFHSIEARAASGVDPVERRGKAVGLVLDRRDAEPLDTLRERSFFVGEPAWDSDARFLTAAPPPTTEPASAE